MMQCFILTKCVPFLLYFSTFLLLTILLRECGYERTFRPNRLSKWDLLRLPIVKTSSPPSAQHRRSSWKVVFRPQNDLRHRQSGEWRWVGLRTVSKVSNSAWVVAGLRSSSSVTTPLTFAASGVWMELRLLIHAGSHCSCSVFSHLTS